jgi:hypothetical protein
LVYFSGFGLLYQEKSVNPALKWAWLKWNILQINLSSDSQTFFEAVVERLSEMFVRNVRTKDYDKRLAPWCGRETNIS